MKKLAIYGAGGLGREIASMIKDINQNAPEWEVVGFFDDGKKKNEVVDDLPVLGGLNQVNSIKTELSIAVAISDPQAKRKVTEKITNAKIKFPVLIHPACVSGDKKFNRFGRGTILTAGVILTTEILVGDFVLINLATTVGHDARIGKFSSIMPGCSISGNVSLGKACVMGTGARVLQNISIGDDSVIGAGAVVTKSFGNKVKLLGVPAVNVE